MGNFPLFLDGTLNSNNRWVVLASLIPCYAVEGRFGVGKRRYRLDKIMTKLIETSQRVIALIFMV